MTYVQREELLREAVIEAARQFMFLQLRAERFAGRLNADDPESLERYNAVVAQELEGLQVLRDALSAERRGR